MNLSSSNDGQFERMVEGVQVVENNKSFINHESTINITTNASSISSGSSDSSKTSTEEGVTSPLAWLGAIVCFAINCSCAMMWMTGPSTPAVMSKWMDVSLTQLNWLSNASSIVNSIFSLCTAWAYDKFGLKYSLILCGLINTLGCWIRCIAIIAPADKRYILVMLGQVVSSIGGPLVYRYGNSIHLRLFDILKS